jgi:hypothetical protein
MLARTVASLKATVVFDASVQLQKEPGCSVEGLPSCEQGAQAPSLLSHSVRASHSWPKKVSCCSPNSHHYVALPKNFFGHAELA